MFLSGAVKKLTARSAGSFKVLKKINPNAFVIDLPTDFGISSTFNILDLVTYIGPFNPDHLLVDLDELTPSLYLRDSICLHYLLYLFHLQQNRLIVLRMTKSSPPEMVVADDI